MSTWRWGAKLISHAVSFSGDWIAWQKTIVRGSCICQVHQMPILFLQFLWKLLISMHYSVL